MNIRNDVNSIINKLIIDINPYEKTYEYLKKDLSLFNTTGKLLVISIGKASYDMALAAHDLLQDKISKGIVITKYNHSKDPIDNFEIYEAGHPILDINSVNSTNRVLEITNNLTKEDKIIFLVSGGGSALFEKPIIELEKLQEINDELIKSGASINEINIIRKRLSLVKGGKFSKYCKPAHVYSYILSDVVGNDLSAIASGPSSIDNSTKEDVLDIINKYNLHIDKQLVYMDGIKDIDNVTNTIIGSVDILCEYTKKHLEELGYHSSIIQKDYTGTVSALATKLGQLAIENQNSNKSLAFIYGGESTVKVTGNGKGGRNSEMALRACKMLCECKDTCVFCFGSDGSDGPTDSAGGYVDEHTYSQIENIDQYLSNNDSYNALLQTNGLLITGPTGSNMNDIYVLLIKR